MSSHVMLRVSACTADNLKAATAAGELDCNITTAVHLPNLCKVEGNVTICGKVTAPNLRHVGGTLYVGDLGEFDHSGIEFALGKVIAVSRYALFYKNGRYRSACRGPWTAEQALAHWDPKKYWQITYGGYHRAQVFRQAILMNEASLCDEVTA